MERTVANWRPSVLDEEMVTAQPQLIGSTWEYRPIVVRADFFHKTTHLDFHVKPPSVIILTINYD